jgi:glycosyltransferase involved in cell wall biosynthesis
LLKPILLVKQILKSLLLIKNEPVYASAPLLSSALPALIIKKLKGNMLIADWDDAFMDFTKKTPSVFSSHYWELALLKNADKVVVVSKTLEKIATEIKGKENVLYLPNGVDTEKFKPDKEQINDKLTVGIIGYIGKIDDRFAYQEMAEVAKDIDANFVVIGHGKGMKNFKSFVKENNMENKFSFFNYVKHEDMPSFIAKMDICLVPFGNFFTSTTRSSVKMKEFMSMGRAIVASNIGENITDLENGKCGLLAKDNQEFIKKIQILQKRKNYRNQLGSKARTRAKMVYDFKILRKKLGNFIDL